MFGSIYSVTYYVIRVESNRLNRRSVMFEIIMLTGFLVAAVSQLLPEETEQPKLDTYRGKIRRAEKSQSTDPKQTGQTRQPRVHGKYGAVRGENKFQLRTSRKVA